MGQPCHLLCTWAGEQNGRQAQAPLATLVFLNFGWVKHSPPSDSRCNTGLCVHAGSTSPAVDCFAQTT